MIIHDHTITAAGEQYSCRTHDSTTLEPEAVLEEWAAAEKKGGGS